MKALLLLHACIFLCINIYAQKAQIEFYADEPTAVYLFEPLDNAYNYQHATDTLQLKPKLKIGYTIQVADFKFVAMNIPKLGQFILPLINGNKLQLTFKGKELSFSGDNAAGIVYFNNEFIKKGLASYIENIDTTFDKLLESGSYIQTYQQCLKEVTRDIFCYIDSLSTTQQVSNQFSQIIKTDLNYAFNFYIINKYRLTQEKSPEDSIAIETAINNIYSSNSIHTPNILKYNYAFPYVSYYYERKNHKKDTDFGAYSYFLTAPSHILLPYIGKALLIDLMYGVKSFNHKNVYIYLASHFPDSDYVRIFKPLFIDADVNETVRQTDSIQFITPTISQLEDLSQLDPFKKKYILLDLWATWCVPCKLEFQYATVVHDILKRYPNLSLLYISIDEDRFNNHWKKTVNNLHLNGWHLRVDNERLYQDIMGKVYVNEKVTIPRYILLSPDGKIVHSDLPRPSSQHKLIEVLDNILQ